MVTEVDAGDKGSAMERGSTEVLPDFHGSGAGSDPGRLHLDESKEAAERIAERANQMKKAAPGSYPELNITIDLIRVVQTLIGEIEAADVPTMRMPLLKLRGNTQDGKDEEA